jgi:hypothetical protein
MCHEDQRWMKLTQDHVQWWTLVLEALKLLVLLPEIDLVSYSFDH